MSPTPFTTLALPDQLIGQGILLRARHASDTDFLQELYLSVRWPEFADTGWSDQEKRNFLHYQFSMQSHHYHNHYPGADFAVIEKDGTPIGRLYLWRRTQDIHIIDISLLPFARNRGLGSALLTALQDEARHDGKTISLHVEMFNPARQLYRRSGFHLVSDTPPYYRMEWREQRR